MHFIEVKKKEGVNKDTHEAHCKAAFTYDHRDNKKSTLPHIYIYIYVCMYDVQHVAGTSNAIARGSDGDRFEKFTRYNRLSTTVLAFDLLF